ncbi:TonB-dependent receptor [Chitinispirillum alkaliphilum]|nr:TonB-dependent receptor [Chitinispirillum alkaliphilum]
MQIAVGGVPHRLLRLSVKAVCILIVIVQVCLAAENIHTLDEMVVTGTKTEVKMTNITENMTVIDSMDLAVSGASTAEEFFDRQPGMTVVSGMGRSQLQINGLGGQYTKMLINGVPLTGGYVGGFPLENLPFMEIERVEVLKGIGSALYGSDAIGGVVNIITRRNRANSPLELRVRGRYNSNLTSTQFTEPGFAPIRPVGTSNVWPGQFSGGLMVSHMSDMLGASFSAGSFYTPGVKDVVKPSRVRPERPYYTIPEQLRTNYRLEINTDQFLDMDLSVSGAYSDNERKYSLVDTDEIHSKNERFDITVAAQKELSDQIDMGGFFTAQRSVYKRDRFSHDSDRYIEREITQFPQMEAEVRGNVAPGQSHVVTAGVNFKYDGLKAEYIKDGGKSAGEISLFVQDVINIGGDDRYLITPGMRFTYNTRFDPVILPKISARANLSEFLHLRASAGFGYRSPSYQDNYRDEWVHTGGIFVLSGNPDLKPEKARGVNGSIGGVGSDNVEWEATAHWTKMYDKITTQEVSTDTGRTSDGEFYEAVRQYVNADSGYTRGADFSIGYRISRDTRITFDYNYLQRRFWDANGRLVDELNTSPHTLKKSLSYRFGDIERFVPTLMVSGVWRDKQLYSRTENTYRPSNFDMNASVTVRVSPNVRFALGGNNLFDNTEELWGQTLGRSVYANFDMNFKVF